MSFQLSSQFAKAFIRKNLAPGLQVSTSARMHSGRPLDVISEALSSKDTADLFTRLDSLGVYSKVGWDRTSREYYLSHTSKNGEKLKHYPIASTSKGPEDLAKAMTAHLKVVLERTLGTKRVGPHQLYLPDPVVDQPTFASMLKQSNPLFETIEEKPVPSVLSAVKRPQFTEGQGSSLWGQNVSIFAYDRQGSSRGRCYGELIHSQWAETPVSKPGSLKSSPSFTSNDVPLLERNLSSASLRQKPQTFGETTSLTQKPVSKEKAPSISSFYSKTDSLESDVSSVVNNAPLRVWKETEPAKWSVYGGMRPALLHPKPKPGPAERLKRKMELFAEEYPQSSTPSSLFERTVTPPLLIPKIMCSTPANVYSSAWHISWKPQPGRSASPSQYTYSGPDPEGRGKAMIMERVRYWDNLSKTAPWRVC